MHILPVRADGGCAAVMIRRTMNYTISNDQIEVVISDVGAELMSVKSRKDGTEFLWQGDPTFWGGRAYNLFPICGRLADGKYTYEGETYEMNLHGFVRKSVLDATPLAPAHAELFVNPMQAIRCAAARDPATLLREEKDIPWSAGHELALYIAHGLDHLSGADDATYEGYRTMRRRELRWLSDIPDEILSGIFVS